MDDDTPTTMTDRTPDDSISDDPFSFNISEDLTPSPSHRQPETTTLDFDGLLPAGKALQLHQDLARGNGGQAWPAGVVLVKYLLRRKREDLRGCRMLVSHLFLSRRFGDRVLLISMVVCV